MDTDAAAANAIASGLLRASGMGSGPARRTAWALVAAETCGRASHGLLRLPYYLDRFAAGGTDPRATLDLVRSTTVTAAYDGGNGLGHWQAWDAAVTATEMAASQGIAAVSIANSGHCGVLGLYVRPMVDAGLVGLVLSTGPAVIPPPGGSRAVLSTSPIAAGIPMRPRAAVVDVAMSAVARGRIAEYAASGGQIPAGWAYDADGSPTTDAHAALAGLLAPLGGAKGFALAFLVESLTAGMVGPSLAAEIADPLAPLSAGDPQRIAHLVIAIDPACLDVDGDSHARLDRLGSSIVSAGGRIPGADRRAPAEMHDHDRVTIPGPLAATLVALARDRGVEVPDGFASG